MFEKRRKKSTQKLFHLHVPKAGGTSFLEYGKKQYATKDTLTHLESEARWIADGVRRDALAEKKFLSGHIYFIHAYPWLSHHGYQSVANFRNPLKQLSSHLRWIKRLSQPWYRIEFHRMDKSIQKTAQRLQYIDFSNPFALEQFFSTIEESKIFFDNYQTRFFSSAHQNEFVQEQHLAEAIENIKKIDFLLIIEQYQASCNMIADALGWQHLKKAQKKNVFEKSYGLDIHNPETARVLQQYNSFDQQLYDAAVKMYKERLTNEPI